jgi:predicted nucleic acid-binding Zn ribbon protein
MYDGGRLEYQRSFLDDYLAARKTDRVPLKQDYRRRYAGPVLDFVNLASGPRDETDRAALRFTAQYGPLFWTGHYRMRSRRARVGERRGGARWGRRVLGRCEWSMPARQFWSEQRQFRAIFRLALALTDAKAELTSAIADALAAGPLIRDDLIRVLREESYTLSAPDTPVTNHDVAKTHEWLETAAKTQRHFPRMLAGEAVAELLDRQQKRCLKPISFDSKEGFRQQVECESLRDALYLVFSLEVVESHRYRFCLNCGGIFYQGRPDKRTCSHRCATLLGKRDWARKARALRKAAPH